MDPGFANTGSCRSAITFIDGEQGILRCRGYDIADLAEHTTFPETAMLLLKGELPTISRVSSCQTSGAFGWAIITRMIGSVSGGRTMVMTSRRCLQHLLGSRPEKFLARSWPSGQEHVRAAGSTVQVTPASE